MVADVTLDLEGWSNRRPAVWSRSPRPPAEGRRSLRPPRAMDRAWQDRRNAGERGFVIATGWHRRSSARPSSMGGCESSRSSASRCRPSSSTASDRASSCQTIAVRHLLDGREALAAAFDMEGGFNDVVLALSPGASSEEVMARLDRLLEPYGGLGAIPRALQLSHWTVENELSQLQSFGFLLPSIFLTGRRVHSQRRADESAGASAAADRLAQSPRLRQRGHRLALPEVGLRHRCRRHRHWRRCRRILRLDGHRPLQRLLPISRAELRRPAECRHRLCRVDILAAGAGTFGAVMRAVRIPPAEAMRPEVPARYKRTLLETPLISRYLGTAGRMVLRNIARHPFRAAASVFGISFAVAILMVGLVFNDVIDRLIQTQFFQAERQDVTVNFVEPEAAPRSTRSAVCPESSRSSRSVPSPFACAPHIASDTSPLPGYRRLHVSNASSIATANRFASPGGVVLSQTLANALEVRTGDVVTMEVLEGHRPIRQVEVTGLVDDLLGLSAYMDIDALHQMMQEGDVATGALMLVDAAQEAELSTTLKETPTVAGTGFKRSVLKRFREVLAANLGLSIFINLVFASVIAFGVVYNAARISLSERSRELASLRVLGFTRAEISLILMGELALLTLVSLPVGGVFGYSLAAGMMGSIDSEVYRFPLYVSRQAVAWSFLGIIGAALVSGLIVRRKLDALDLVAVLR